MRLLLLRGQIPEGHRPPLTGPAARWPRAEPRRLWGSGSEIGEGGEERGNDELERERERG